MEERTKRPFTVERHSESTSVDSPDIPAQGVTSRRMRFACALACPWTARVLFAVVIALAALYAFSEYRKSGTTSQALARASSRFDIYLVAQGLQAYRDALGTFPATLEEAGLDQEGIEYVTNGTSYRLIAVQDSTSLVFTEGTNLDRLQAAFEVLEGSAAR